MIRIWLKASQDWVQLYI